MLPMRPLLMIASWMTLLLLTDVSGHAQEDQWPDIRSAEADLHVPAVLQSPPAAGKRVRRTIIPQTTGSWNSATVYHSLYLPGDWSAEKQWPVIVELPGNGGYKDPLGDECSGRPEDCHFGYGITGGQNFLWICLPFLNNDGSEIATTWWGTAPDYNPQPTLEYWRAAVDDACKTFSGDKDRVILCGFSRGAIACNSLGLYDDKIAKLWRAFVPCSHYDGVRPWPFPGSDSLTASERLKRLDGRPQFICGEKDQTEETRRYLHPFKLEHLTFSPTGFRNHSDQWILRPSPARNQLRSWLTSVLQDENDNQK